MRRIFLFVPVAVLLVGCGGTGEQQREAVDPAQGATSVSSSADLHRAFASRVLGPVTISVADGAIVLGGVVTEPDDDGEPRFTALDDAWMVRPDGGASPLPDLPLDAPSVNASADARDGLVSIVGTTCDRGRGPSEVGEVSCDPGGRALVQLDVQHETWRELSLPADAGAPVGVVGDQQVYALDGEVLVYGVTTSMDGAAERWVTTDGGEGWARIEAPSGFLCASEGVLVAVDDTTLADGPGGGEVVTSEDPPLPLSVTVQVFDANARTWEAAEGSVPELSVIAAATGWTCTPDAGVVALVRDGDGRGTSLLRFRADQRWQQLALEDGTAIGGVTSLVGAQLVVGDIRGGLVLVDLETSVIDPITSIHSGSSVVVGVGRDDVLVRSPSGDVKVMTVRS